MMVGWLFGYLEVEGVDAVLRPRSHTTMIVGMARRPGTTMGRYTAVKDIGPMCPKARKVAQIPEYKRQGGAAAP